MLCFYTQPTLKYEQQVLAIPLSESLTLPPCQAQTKPLS
jgi:hypothetical protein